MEKVAQPFRPQKYNQQSWILGKVLKRKPFSQSILQCLNGFFSLQLVFHCNNIKKLLTCQVCRYAFLWFKTMLFDFLLQSP